MTKLQSLKVALVGLLIASFNAHAALDLTPLTGQISFADVVTALLAAGAAVMGVYLARKAIDWILSQVKRA